jgi:hypothetical protein
MHVYISRPTAHAAPPVVDACDVSELLFNLPCTIAGGKGTLAIDSGSVVNTGCATISLLSAKAATRLQLSLQPCTRSFAIMAAGGITAC